MIRSFCKKKILKKIKYNVLSEVYKNNLVIHLYILVYSFITNFKIQNINE